MPGTFLMKLDSMQPSQLFISSEKLSEVMRSSAPLVPESIEPVPVRQLGEQVILTDGHTRALAAFLAGLSEVRAFWDEDELDWEAYAICVEWCREEGVHTVADLAGRVVSPEEYELLWHERCRQMHRQLQAKRGVKQEG
ncbi:MAG: hypothetical protein AMJ81_00250 [Phycisphaerae bacterium SM23_33]|jgi:hypothetical protein|nr:MAG: hypothetical protein AMJ81_00250 [Phycisphaerae bacterium SM23_33]